MPEVSPTHHSMMTAVTSHLSMISIFLPAIAFAASDVHTVKLCSLAQKAQCHVASLSSTSASSGLRNRKECTLMLKDLIYTVDVLAVAGKTP